MAALRYTPTARIAARHGGAVHRRELLALGHDRGWIAHKVELGYLIPEHRGVFWVGHRPSSRSSAWHAAVLMAGEGAAVAGLSAVAIHAGWPEPGRRVELVTTRHVRSTPKVLVRRTRRLPEEHVMRRGGIPVTTPLRTVLDCAAFLPPDRLVQLAMELEFRRMLSLSALAGAQLPGRGGPAWAHLLRHIAEGTRTELEAAFLELCVAHEIPRPEVNQRVADFWPDFLWREHRFIVETDGWGVHQTRRQFERDRQKAAGLVAAGYDVLPTTWRAIRDQPTLVANAIRARLARGVS